MKKSLVILILSFVIFSSARAATLVGYDIPTSTTTNTVSPMTTGTGVTASAVTAGSGLSLLSANTSSSRWQATSYNQTAQTDAALDAANTGGDYWAFSITAATGYNLTINGIGSFQWGASTSGPKNFALLYSANSFSTYSVVVKSQFGANGNTNATAEWNAALASAPISVPEGTTASFRIVGYGASLNTGTGGMLGNLTAPDFTVLGNAVSTSPVFNWTGGTGNWASGVNANWQVGGVSTAWVNDSDVTFSAGGNLTVDSSGVTAKGVSITGTSPLTWQGGTVGASSVVMGADSSLNLLGSGTNNIGTLDLTDATLSGGNLLGTLYNITINAGSKTISSTLTGTALFAKVGSGELVLSAPTANTVQISVGAGTLTTGQSEVLSDTASLKVDNLATLKLGGNETIGALNAVYGSFINLQGFTLTSGANGASFTNGATITGAGSLVKNGTGQMYLNNSTNTFSGGFTLNGGDVAFTSSGSAANGVITNTVFGTGPVTINGGTLTSSSAGSGRNIYNNVFLNGDVQFGTTAWGATNATMNTSTSIDTSKTSNNVTFPQNAVITVSTNAAGATTLQKDLTVSTIAYVDWYQPINGNYRITKSGTGAYSLSNNYLQLRASNNIAGVTVNSGLLTYKNRNAFGSGTLILKDGVAIGQDGAINNSPLTGNDQIDRSVPNDISIEGNVAFGTGSTANYLGGNINLNGGDRSITVINTTYLYGVISNGALTVFDTSPSRTLNLLASNSYAGGTTQNGGILSLGHDSALGGGGLTVFSNNPYTNVTTNISATVTTNVAGGVTNKTTNYISTNITTNVTVASNRLTISSDRVLANNISLNSGALYTIEAPQLVTTSVDSGTGVTNSVTNNSTFVINGSISGGGAIIKSGLGLLRLTGGLSYSGDTTVSNGTLERITNNISASITTNTIAITFSNSPANGTYAVLPGALTGTYSATYNNLSPSQIATFSTVSPASVTVASKASQSITGLASTDTKTFGASSYALGVTKGASTSSLSFFSDNNSVATVSSAGQVTIVGAGFTIIRVNQAGDANYLAASEVTQTLTVAKANPTITAAPTASDITSGQALSSSILSGGSGSVPGSFGWTSPSTVPTGTGSFSVTFTPSDAANYNTATRDVSVTVTSSGPNFADSYKNKNMADIAPNGLSYLMNYAFGGSDNTEPKLPVQDTSDPAKLTLVAYVRTGDSTLSVVGEVASELPNFDSANTIAGDVMSSSDVPAGMEKRRYSVSVSGDKKFLRLKAIKQ